MRWLILAVAAAGLSTAAISAAFDPRANQVIDKTRTTTATYSIYNWSRVTPPDGNATEGWAAEFHKGNLHRVETPHVRIIADCAAVMGTYRNVDTGETGTNAQVARVACGIAAAVPIHSTEWVARVNSRFGALDRIRVTDERNIRTYDVAGNGAIVNGSIADSDGTMRLDGVGTALLPTLPEEDIFSTESLQQSVVPEQYKQRPKRR
jgi:hypothetical protein